MLNEVERLRKGRGLPPLSRGKDKELKPLKETKRLNKDELKKVICACLERVYNSDGMIESAKADAMRAIDEFVDDFDYLNSDVSLTQKNIKGVKNEL